MKTLTLEIPSAAAGERYVGTILRADGTGHHLFRGAQPPGRMTCQEAMDYAAEQGMELPDRVEGALMNATKEESEYAETWYWTREQCAGDDECAWCQSFDFGTQDYDHKSHNCRVVLVRRVAIQFLSD